RSGDRRAARQGPGRDRDRAREPQPAPGRAARRRPARARGAVVSASLGPVREVWAQRSRARTRGDLLYLLYVVAMGAVVLGLPALLSAGRALARGDVLALLLSAGAPPTAIALSLAVAAGLVGLGAVRGPALLPPFFTATLAGGPLPRGRVLRRPFARALLLPLLAGALPAVLVAATLMAADRTGPGTAALLALAGVGLGLLWGGAWSAGQLLRPTPRRLLILLVGLGAAIAAAPPLMAVRELARGMWSQSV